MEYMENPNILLIKNALLIKNENMFLVKKVRIVENAKK